MSFLFAFLAVLAVYIVADFVTWDLSAFPPVAVICAILLIGIFTSGTTVEDLSRSEISYSKHSVGTERVVYVRHEKASVELHDPYIYENVGDTTRVDFKLEKTTNAWLWRPIYEIEAETQVP